VIQMISQDAPTRFELGGCACRRCCGVVDTWTLVLPGSLSIALIDFNSQRSGHFAPPLRFGIYALEVQTLRPHRMFLCEKFLPFPNSNSLTRGLLLQPRAFRCFDQLTSLNPSSRRWALGSTVILSFNTFSIVFHCSSRTDW
jgi:hypothetical protein